MISKWIDNPDGCSLCWLSGPVGTGKSAIAQTISQRCADEGRLAATFFCSRRDAFRSNGKTLILTIAYQLATAFPSLKYAIFAVVENDPLILERGIPVQFQHLIINPIMQNSDVLPRMVVVIDALDECDDQSASEIARLLPSVAKNHDLPLLFLITSRPTSDIELPFMRNSSVVRFFALRDFDVRDDIRLFLTRRFEEIYEDHLITMREVVKPWPSADQIDQLMDMSHHLFIYASSITRYVDDRSYSPDDRLKTILAAESVCICGTRSAV